MKILHAYPLACQTLTPRMIPLPGIQLVAGWFHGAYDHSERESGSLAGKRIGMLSFI
jgi:hypothetical protein